MKKYFLVFLALTTLFSFSPSRRSEAAEVAAHEEIPAVLDYDRRRSYSYRFELSPYGGDLFGDKLGHTFAIAGLNSQLNLTEQLAFAVDFDYAHLLVDRTSAFGSIFANPNGYIIDGALIYSVPAAYRSLRGVTEADFFTSLGGGVLRLNDSNHAGAFIGGGMKIRTKVKWLAIRVEIRNYFTTVSNPAGTDFEDILTVHIGPTFLLPPEM